MDTNSYSINDTNPSFIKNTNPTLILINQYQGCIANPPVANTYQECEFNLFTNTNGSIYDIFLSKVLLLSIFYKNDMLLIGDDWSLERKNYKIVV